MKGGVFLNLQLSARNRTYRNALIDSIPTISAERARIVTGVYQENEHLPSITRAALGLKAVLDQMTGRRPARIHNQSCRQYLDCG